MSFAESLPSPRMAMRRRPWPARSVRIAGFGALALVALALWGWPLGGFLLEAFVPGLLHGALHLSLGAFSDALHAGIATALRNSLLVALTAALLALPLGGWLAWLRVRSTLAWRAWIEAGVWALLVMPGYFLASGWMLLAAPIGPLRALPTLLGTAQALLGPIGIVLTLSLKALPFAYLALQGALEHSGAAAQEAARVHGLRAAQRLRLALAALLPALAAGFAAAYAESISDFAVAATLGAGSGVQLATYSIEQAVNSMPLDFPAAAASSWLLLALVVPALLVQARAARSSHGSVGPRHRPAAPVRLSRRAALGHGLAVAVLALGALGTPVLAAAQLALGPVADAGAGSAAVLPALGYSLRLAVLAASVTIVLAWPLATLLNRRGGAARVLDPLLVGVMALPGVVLAAAYVLAYNQPITPLYGGSTLLAMAYVALALPIATKVLQGPLAQLHVRLGEAARVHGLSRLRTLRAIELPLAARALFSAWLLAALHIAFELPASELLYPAGHPPLAVALLDAAAGFQLQLQARLQLLGIALLLGFALLARLAFGGLAAAARKDPR
jgi:iron(III) transport system permease protein